MRETAGRGKNVRVCRDTGQEKKGTRRDIQRDGRKGMTENRIKKQQKTRVKYDATVARKIGQDEELTLQSKATH